MSDVLVCFKAGDAIPEWLLVAEPQARGASRGAWKFSVDACVVDLGDSYLLLPLAGGDIIDITGAAGPLTIYAPAKTVRRVCQQQFWHTLDAQMVARQTLVPGVVPDPHRSLWARLRYVLTGR